jgi:hypothetical protein
MNTAPLSDQLSLLRQPETYFPVRFGIDTAGSDTAVVLGQNAQGIAASSVAIGSGAYVLTSTGGVAIGNLAGMEQSIYGISLGYIAYIQGSDNGVAIGSNSTVYNSPRSVSIGYQADVQESISSISIGNNARMIGTNRAIVLNATDAALTAQTSDSLYIAPIRQVNGDPNTRLYYNPVSKEITYGTDTYEAAYGMARKLSSSSVYTITLTSATPFVVDPTDVVFTGSAGVTYGAGQFTVSRSALYTVQFRMTTLGDYTLLTPYPTAQFAAYVNGAITPIVQTVVAHYGGYMCETFGTLPLNAGDVIDIRCDGSSLPDNLLNIGDWIFTIRA